MVDVLSRREGATAPISYLEEMVENRRGGFIKDALTLWPLGLVRYVSTLSPSITNHYFRMLTPEIRITGAYMSVLGRDDHAALLRKAAAEVRAVNKSIVDLRLSKVPESLWTSGRL